MNFKKYLSEGQKTKAGKAGKKTVSVEEVGFHFNAEIRDEYGDVESAVILTNQQGIDNFFKEHGIKKIKWSK